MNRSLELSCKSIVIGVILSVLLCGANMYLGLKIGTTISASIPAAILSLGVLKLFKKYSILENSISQTIASSGEALAASIIFVFPALLMLGVWKDFSYWQIVLLGLCGGLIGIAFSVLLRKVLLNDKTLPFPEGNAIGQVLLATNSVGQKSGFKTIMLAMGISGFINICQNGLKILGDSYYKFFKVGNGVVGLGTSFSPAVIGSGFLIGGSTIVAFIGLLIGWLLLLPYFATKYGLQNSSDIVDSAFFLWSHYVRPVGIGVFLFSGVATILMMGRSIVTAIKESLDALAHINDVHIGDRDLNVKKMMLLIAVCMLPVIGFIYSKIMNMQCDSAIMGVMYSVSIAILILVLGFIITAVAGYVVGLVGSSNSPLSGLYFIAVILLSVALKGIVPHQCFIEKYGDLMSIVVCLVAFIAFSAAITNDNIQDYKSGQIVGATPYKQQISLFIGVICSILIAPIMMNLIFHAYGIVGVAAPHAGIDPHNELNAPQAAAIAMITKNIMHGAEDWYLLFLGVVVGFLTFIVDLIGKRSGKFRAPAIMMGLGLYLPPELITSLFIGGILSMIIKRKHKKLRATIGDEATENLASKTNVLVCGLIAGESIMGLLLAVPFVLKQSSNALRIVGEGFTSTAQMLSVIVTALLLFYIYRVATRTTK